MRKLARIRNLLLGLLMFAFAAVLFLEPASGPLLVILILGAGLLIIGLHTVYFYITMARHMVGGKKTFYRGILILSLAAVLLSGYSGSGAMILLYLLGSYAIAGVIDIIRALDLKKEGAPWKHRMVSGLLSIVILLAGIFYRDNPHTVVYIFCVGLLYSGLYRIILAFRKTAIIYIPE